MDTYWFRDPSRTYLEEVEMRPGYILQDVYDQAKSFADKWGCKYSEVEFGLVSTAVE